MGCHITKTYLIQKRRLCESMKNCRECPIGLYSFSIDKLCEIINIRDIESAIRNVQEWSNKDKKKTYLEDLLEKFPNIVLTNSGLPESCLKWFYGSGFECHKWCCSRGEEKECCWDAEMKDQ